MYRCLRVSGLLVALCVPALAQFTYARDVAPIVQAKCQQCHRPNDIAPFALMTYDDVQTYAADIKTAVSAKVMPPWKPVEGFGSLRDSFALTDFERQVILSWIDAGTPLGEMADMPAPPEVNASPWQLGEPDLTLTMPEYKAPRAADTYRCFVLPDSIDANRFVNAMQALPGDKAAVHHVLLYIDTTGQAVKMQDAATDGAGYNCFGGPGFELTLNGMVGGWAPGTRARRLPDGIALLVQAKARLVLQVHYHPNGKSVTDQTQVGLYFADPDSVKSTMINVPVVNTGFTIPPGENNYQVTAKLTMPLPAKAVTIGPHMHLLGKQVKIEVQDRGTTNRRPMIYIDKWDFNWQGFYNFTDPVALPAGSTIIVTGNYDNSDANPLNPNNPLKPVGWGEGTNDEMLVGFVGMILDTQFALPFVKQTVPAFKKKF